MYGRGRKKHLFFAVPAICVLCLIFFPVAVYSQDIKSQTPPVSDEAFQKNTLEDFFIRYNGCSWYRIPYDRSCDISFELRDRMLILYRYLKSEEYCWMTSTICFTNWELLRLKVTGYEMVSTDQRGNEFRVVISKNGETITLHGKDNLGFSENVLGTFIKLFCSEHK